MSSFEQEVNDIVDKLLAEEPPRVVGGIVAKIVAAHNLRVERLREALKFYANEKRWTDDGKCIIHVEVPGTPDNPTEWVEELDYGNVAKKALEEEK